MCSRGGDTGPAVKIDDINASEMILAIRYDGDSYQMPPKGKLPDGEIETLTEWVRRGLPWPKTDETATSGDKTPAISFAERAKQWPFTPLDDAPPPTPTDAAWADNIIDAYILAGLDAADLKPAPEADKAVWLRRATYDLIGLPPTPDEIDGFLADDSPDACERAIDRLLASPHYGERWGRHWLDLVRYAETMGHEFDFEILHAFRYRDYVIRALNEGVPYDRFVIEHIAGDLMSDPRRGPVTGENESIKGTGFYWFGQGKHSPVDIRAEECDTVDNQIDVFSKTFLGLTVACARCHDHKFDPIGTADYYALAGFLQSSRQQWADVSHPGHNQLLTHAITSAKYDARRYGVMSQWNNMTDGNHTSNMLLATRPLLKYDLSEVGPFPEPRIEGESLKILETTGGDARPQEMASFGKGQWSGDSHLWWTDAEVGQQLVLSIPVENEGEYHLSIALTKARDYGIVKVSLDDKTIGEPIDLYDPKVIPTGPISLGTHTWTAGEHRLTLEIAGTNDRAEPSYMVGVDYVAVTPASAQGEADARRKALADADAEVLKLARRIQSRAASAAADLLRPWEVLAKATSTEEFVQMKNQLCDELQALADSFLEPQPEWTDFDKRATADKWHASGFAFKTGVGNSGALVYSPDGEMPVDVVTHNGFHSGIASRRYQGFVRSPTFTIERKHIDYLVRRTGGNANPGRANKNGNISLIVDGFQVIRSPLYGNLTFVVPNDGEWHWHRQNVGKHIGTKAYIEIGDEDDGFIEVAAIRLTDGDLGPTTPNPLMIDLLADESITTPEQLAAGYERLIREAFERRRAGQLAAGDAEWLQLLVETPVAGGDPALAQRLSKLLRRLANLEAEIHPPPGHSR